MNLRVTGMALVVMLAKGVSAFAADAGYEDFHQRWILKETLAGECSAGMSLRRTEFFNQGFVVMDQYASLDVIHQQIFPIGDTVQNGDRTQVGVEGQRLTIKKYRGRSARRGALKEALQFDLEFPSLAYRRLNRKNQVVASCVYSVENPEMHRAPTSCSLTYKGQPIEGASCQFVPDSEGRAKCEISGPVTVEDSWEGLDGNPAVRPVTFQDWRISGPLVSGSLNRSNDGYHVVYVSSDLGHRNDYMTMIESREIQVFSDPLGDLLLRCQ